MSNPVNGSDFDEMVEQRLDLLLRNQDEVKTQLGHIADIVQELRLLRSDLVQALTKHLPDGHIPLDTFRELMETNDRSHRISMWIMAALFFGCLIFFKLASADFFVGLAHRLLGQ